MRIIIATLSIIFALGVLAVSFVNYTESVSFHLLPDMPDYTYPNTPVSWVIFLSAVAGFVFTGIIAMLEGSKTRLSNAQLRAQVQRLQQEVTALKRPSTELNLDDNEIPQASIADEMEDTALTGPGESGPSSI